MYGKDVRDAGQVGYRASQLDDAGAGSCGQAHAVDDVLQDFTTFGRQGTVLLYLTVVHCRIAENAFAGQTSLLYFPGRQNPGCHTIT